MEKINEWTISTPTTRLLNIPHSSVASSSPLAQWGTKSQTWMRGMHTRSPHGNSSNGHVQSSLTSEAEETFIDISMGNSSSGHVQSSLTSEAEETFIEMSSGASYGQGDCRPCFSHIIQIVCTWKWRYLFLFAMSKYRDIWTNSTTHFLVNPLSANPTYTYKYIYI